MQIVLICIIGGIGTILGPVVGSLVLVPLSEALRSNMITEGLVKIGPGLREDSGVGIFLKENLAHAHVLIYGILVVVVILFMPDGVLGFVRKLACAESKGGVLMAILEIKHVSKFFGGLAANSDVSFAVDARHDHGAHRPQRRGQDHPLQLHHRLLPALQGRDPLQGATA